MNALELFNHRVTSEWLPAFCKDKKRNYDFAGFVAKPNELSDQDSKEFMRAMDEKIVSVDSGGRFTMPQSKATEVNFWEHDRSISPRPISLWIEPVVTISANARLHFGWPLASLGMQPDSVKTTGEFDICRR
jgi:hypothetical protein